MTFSGVPINALARRRAVAPWHTQTLTFTEPPQIAVNDGRGCPPITGAYGSSTTTTTTGMHAGREWPDQLSRPCYVFDEPEAPPASTRGVAEDGLLTLNGGACSCPLARLFL